MNLVAQIVYLLLFLFVIAMFVRIVLDVVQMAARQWRPRGLALLTAEVVYSTTDPPIRALRRVLPPLRLGGIALDLAFLVVMLVAWVLLQVFGALALA